MGSLELVELLEERLKLLKVEVGLTEDVLDPVLVAGQLLDVFKFSLGDERNIVIIFLVVRVAIAVALALLLVGLQALDEVAMLILPPFEDTLVRGSFGVPLHPREQGDEQAFAGRLESIH